MSRIARTSVAVLFGAGLALTLAGPALAAPTVEGRPPSCFAGPAAEGKCSPTLDLGRSWMSTPATAHRSMGHHWAI